MVKQILLIYREIHIRYWNRNEDCYIDAKRVVVWSATQLFSRAHCECVKRLDDPKVIFGLYLT